MCFPMICAEFKEFLYGYSAPAARRSKCSCLNWQGHCHDINVCARTYGEIVAHAKSRLTLLAETIRMVTETQTQPRLPSPHHHPPPNSPKLCLFVGMMFSKWGGGGLAARFVVVVVCLFVCFWEIIQSIVTLPRSLDEAVYSVVRKSAYSSRTTKSNVCFLFCICDGHIYELCHRRNQGNLSDYSVFKKASPWVFLLVCRERETQESDGQTFSLDWRA